MSAPWHAAAARWLDHGPGEQLLQCLGGAPVDGRRGNKRRLLLFTLSQSHLNTIETRDC
jgi:hypothetical protein